MSLLPVLLAPLRLTRWWGLLGDTCLDGRWLIFAVGVLVYYQTNYAPRRVARAILGALVVGAVAGAASGLTSRMIGHELVIAMGFGALLGVLHPHDGPIARSPAAQPLAACGVLCYSLYLVHWPVVRLVSNVCDRAGVQGVWPVLAGDLPIAAAASLICAGLFHWGIERRFLNPPAPPATG